MVFVTGGTGLVGGHLLIQLVKRGIAVRALRRERSQFSELATICNFYQLDFNRVMQTVDWVVGDVLEKESIRPLLQGIDTVYHCAAVVSFGACSPATLQEVNIAGTRNLLELALEAGVGCFAFVSSIGALGQSVDGETITEETPWNPQNQSSVYSNSKYESEQVVFEAVAKGLDVVIVNPGIILGAGDFKKGSLKFFSQVEKGMPFYTCQQTGYVDVRDVCTALLLLVDKRLYNRRYILVGENLTNKQLFTLIAKAMGKRPPFLPVGKWGLRLASRLNRFICRFTGRQPLLTPEIVRSATKRESYSSTRMIRETGFRFTPMNECISAIITTFTAIQNK